MRRLLTAGFLLTATTFAYASPVAANDRRICDTTSGAQAIAACTRLIATGKVPQRDLATTYFNRGSHLLNNGELDRALKDFDTTIALNPKNTLAHYLRSTAWIRKGDYDRAIADAARAISVNPKYAFAYNNRGFAYHQLRRYDAAIGDFDEAIRLDQKTPNYYSNRGNSLQEKGDIDRALADHDRAIELNPKLAPLYSNRGGAWREKGNLDRALADYDYAIKIDPKLPHPYVGRGLIWRAKGEFDRAIFDYDKAIEINPNLAGPYTGRALTYESKGDTDSAKRDFKTALTLASGVVVRASGTEQFVDIRADRFKAIARARLAILSEVDHTPTLPSSKEAAPPPVAPPRAIGRRIALVVGNGAYVSAKPLPNPANDARVIAKNLRDMRFEVSEGIDLDRPGMKKLIGDFLRGAATARVAVLFYAGHGIQIEGKNFLLPVDVKFETGADLTAEMTDVDTILAGLDDQIRTNIVILDAYRDNPLAEKVAEIAGASRSVKVRSGLAAPSDLGKGGTVGAGTLLAFATAPGQLALDGDGTNSPFTTALARHIGTPGLEVQQMLTRVRADVVTVTKSRQVPWSNSSLLGEVYLAAN